MNEDLRLHYITPLYLKIMSDRARTWSEEFIQSQIEYFQRTIPDYPEVFAVLENALAARKLNAFRREVRASRPERLAELSGEKLSSEYSEILQAELGIRSGVRRLEDSGKEADVVLE